MKHVTATTGLHADPVTAGRHGDTVSMGSGSDVAPNRRGDSALPTEPPDNASPSEPRGDASSGEVHEVVALSARPGRSRPAPGARSERSGHSGHTSRGRVWLVGAGPGDPELLTLKAARVISGATVLLVDDLVGDGVIALADARARIVHVGKRGGCASTPQAFIDRLIVAEALKGERVVRLKGGDPFLFGRGGEEAEHLRAHGIEVEVVNGISSGVAAAAALGTPLTHRDHAHGVIFVTGHARADGAALHWPTLGAAAAQGLTLVVYMGVTAIEAIAAGLLQTLPGETPAAVVQSASLPSERRLHCTLGGLAGAVRDGGIGSPAIVIVGNVLKGANALAAAGAAPLAGHRMA